MVRHLVIGLVLIVGGGQQLPAAENWPQWRGPLGNGVAADGDYPVEFSDEAGVLGRCRCRARAVRRQRCGAIASS